MSSGFMRAECRKFIPNIFNKSKCSNCFRQKEEHSAEALESNRAARKISKCGYLFVAPGWDFTNPVNKTKRWQRRWFVLYDDGELNYSVDEHPETVPQASIDMNKVVEVTDAEEVTGHPYSLAITAPDTVHFVKGTCREEAKWWKEVLAIFPRSKGRHKRNATFPGTQTTALLQQTPLSCRNSADSPRPRFNSCHTETSVLVHRTNQWMCGDEENMYPIKGGDHGEPDYRESPPPVSHSTPSPSLNYTSVFKDSTSSPISTPSTVHAYSPITTPTSYSPTYSSNTPTSDVIKYMDNYSTSNTKTAISYRKSPSPSNVSSLSSSLSSLSSANLVTQPATSTSPPTRDKLHAEEKARARREKRGRSLTEQIRREKLKDIADSLTRPRTRPRASLPSQHPPPTRDHDADAEDEVDTGKRTLLDDVKNDTTVRGDPDGCGLDSSSHRYSPSAELRVALPAEDLLNLKKGWLMKQNGAEWSKHWFVLRGAALMYYRDPTAEDKGILDGVLDLSSVRAVSELQVQRNYGFQTVCWDERRFVLSAVTAGIRNNWIAAIRRAAGLPEQARPPMTLGEKLELELHENNPHYFDKPSYNSSSSIDRLNEGLQRSSSESTNRSYLSTEHPSPGWSHPTTPLPPSPPLTRTPISRVKERAKTQISRSRVYNKRSKSSPPSSRRNTLDTIRAPPVPEAESYPRRRSFSKVLDEPAKSGEWTDSSMDKPWSMKIGDSSLLRGRSVDSLSDLTNIDLDLDLSSLDKARIVEEYEELKGRFEKAVMEIRAMKRELRQSQAACDELELAGIRLRQDAKCKEDADKAEAALMAARIQDLALKLSAAEKQTRALKQKTSKAESREKRRSLSLKGRESFQIGREVEEKLAELETKMSEIEAGNSSKQATPTKSSASAKSHLRRKSLDSATSEPISVLLRLTSLEGRLKGVDPGKKSDMKEAAATLVNHLEMLLTERLRDLVQRRQQLAQENRLNDAERQKLAAERLAVESVLVRKVWDAVKCYGQGKTLVTASEVEELSAMVAAVRGRIRGENTSMLNPLNCLTEAVTRRLSAAGDLASDPTRFGPTALAHETDLEDLINNQRNLKQEVDAFRTKIIPQVARSLAMETLCLTAEYEQGRCRDGEDRRLRDAWNAAQETLNKELVQAELSHVALRCSASAEGGARLAWFGVQESEREAWMSEVTESLRVVMDAVVKDLTNEYERCLGVVKRPLRTNAALEKDAAECRATLERLVGILAGYTLVETRIQRLYKGEGMQSETQRPVVRSISLKPDPSDVDIETQCLYLFHRLSSSIASSADVISVGDACSAVISCIEVAQQLARHCGLVQDTQIVSTENVSWHQLAEKCKWLSDTLHLVVQRVSDMQSCSRCPVLQTTLDDLKVKQEEELSRLKQRHDWQLQELRGELETQRDSLVCQHELEQAQLLEKARRLERRLGTLDSEYAQQMENLRAAYQRTLSSELARDEDVEDSIRLRYQAEIQQLRALCEKGLIAVDNSHRRIIVQMEEKHRQELAAAAAEKDQALAEETAATLAALDAMRKAHETEVQREVAKFKTEWLRRMQSTHDLSALHRAHEEEMDEIKAEILSLSQRYSDKCLETARLEEELGTVTKQLSQAQQACLQLDARNRQLRAHLVSESDESPLRIQEDILSSKCLWPVTNMVARSE